jgi:hypothetical protein
MNDDSFEHDLRVAVARSALVTAQSALASGEHLIDDLCLVVAAAVAIARELTELDERTRHLELAAGAGHAAALEEGMPSSDSSPPGALVGR